MWAVCSSQQKDLINVVHEHNQTYCRCFYSNWVSMWEELRDKDVSLWDIVIVKLMFLTLGLHLTTKSKVSYSNQPLWMLEKTHN